MSLEPESDTQTAKENFKAKLKHDSVRFDASFRLAWDCVDRPAGAFPKLICGYACLGRFIPRRAPGGARDHC